MERRDLLTALASIAATSAVTPEAKAQAQNNATGIQGSAQDAPGSSFILNFTNYLIQNQGAQELANSQGNAGLFGEQQPDGSFKLYAQFYFDLAPATAAKVQAILERAKHPLLKIQTR